MVEEQERYGATEREIDAYICGYKCALDDAIVAANEVVHEGYGTED